MPHKGKNKNRGNSSRKNGSRGNRRRTAPSKSDSLVSSSKGGGDLTTIIETWTPLFPSRVVKKLRYSDTVTLTATSGLLATYVFRANDLYDPDFTSTGHQPMGFDQMMQNYNHFVVLKSRATVTFKNYTSVLGSVALRQDADSTALTDYDRLIEYGGLVQAELITAGAYGGATTLMLGVDIAKLQGVSNKALTADPELRGNVGASPVEVTYFHLCLWDAAGNSITVRASIMIEFLAMFVEPRDLVKSLAREEPTYPRSDIKDCQGRPLNGILDSYVNLVK